MDLSQDLIENIFCVKDIKRYNEGKNRAFYTINVACACQMIFGNEKTYKLTIPVSIISFFSLLKNLLLKSSVETKCGECYENLRNVADELMLLGYDLDQDVLFDACVTVSNCVGFRDKYQNGYYIYQEKMDDDYFNYYISSDDEYILDKIMNDEPVDDITKEVKRGLSKSKQNK